MTFLIPFVKMLPQTKIPLSGPKHRNRGKIQRNCVVFYLYYNAKLGIVNHFMTQLRYKISMPTFGDRLREEIEYTGMSQREVAEKAGIKKRALDMYVGYRGSMPSADVAVRLAKVLHVTVEYLVTGENDTSPAENLRKRKLQHDMEKISDPTRQFLETAVHLFAEYEKHNAP